MIWGKARCWLLLFGLLAPTLVGFLGQVIAVSSPPAREVASPSAAAQGQSAASPIHPADTRRHAERLDNLPGLSNMGRVAPGIYRGAQPRSSGYATLRRMGIRTVINLRARHGEKAAVQSAGMHSIEIPIRIDKQVDVRAVRRVVALMMDRANQPLFVHCAQGEDRTGIVMAVYRMEVDGWTNAEAEAEMQAFGFNDVWIHLRTFVRHYRRERTGELGAGVKAGPAER